MAITVKDWNQTDTQYNFLVKILRAILKSLVGEAALATRSMQSANLPSNSAILTAAGTVFTLAANEIGFIRQLNTTNALFYKLGTGASATDFSDVLAAGTANDNGTGAATVIDDYIGAVSVAGTTLRYMAWKRLMTS